MVAKIEFRVPEQPADRADKVLAKAFPETSRSLVKRSIEEGKVLRTNGKPLTAKTKLIPGEFLLVDLRRPSESNLEPFEVSLNILYEDDAIIVVNKKPGMVVHPGDGTGGETLVHALLHHCEGNLCPVGAPKRPGIVHRLDKETSGVMVVAKTEPAYHSLVQQFSDRTVAKKYTAIVVGAMQTQKGSFIEPIGRHPKVRVKMAVIQTGKKAQTEWAVIDTLNEDFSLIDCNLLTGRTHQIRVHFSYAGHPLLGDLTYGYNPNKYTGNLSSRVMLHARDLSFRHPSDGKALTFNTPLPSDMIYTIDQLKESK